MRVTEEQIGRWRRFPVVTMTATGIAVAAAAGQYTVPAMIPALQRDPGGLPDGQWWRLVTPLLVQTLGWYQVAGNLATLALFGVLAERMLGRWRWVALFAGGTLGGELAAYAWHDPGGGDSIAICGLAAGLAIAMLTGPAPPPRFAADAVVYYVAALAGLGFSGLRAAGLACAVAAVVLNGLRLAGIGGATRAALAGAAGCALVLAAARDLHGASLTSGMVLMGGLLLSRGRPGRGSGRS